MLNTGEASVIGTLGHDSDKSGNGKCNLKM